MRTSNELQVGKAGEYLVCADLILKGFVAFPSEQGLPYDVLLDTGNKLLRVQVKTTKKPRKIPQRNKDSLAYIFSIKLHGKSNKKINNDCDIFALVCLDTMKIGYILGNEMPSTINIRADSLRGNYYDEKGISDYKKCIELYKTIKNQSEIARQLNLAVATVNRYLKPDWIPFKTSARYFNDFIRDRQWFQKL
ncbi:MAG: hypothetical protein GX641_04295 [Mollicutes bacterium]|nr:hypothetical protein [Mollicutes bacterium]